MDGITDAPMRALLGALGGFDFAVSEFVRVSVEPLPPKVFLRAIPELRDGGVTPTGLPVQVQILGGDPERMAWSALAACKAGATAIDINFGCPAPTVNRNDGGASILRSPCRVRDIVAEVRSALPPEIPVSAKLRLGWDCIDTIYETAAMAAEGGASWLTIHARTRVQGYNPPVFWKPIGVVREALGLPVVANGDIWNLDDFRQCQDETGCIHFMLGRSALANPRLAWEIRRELEGQAPACPPEQAEDEVRKARLGRARGLTGRPEDAEASVPTDWPPLLHALVNWTEYYEQSSPRHTVKRLKQWLKFADLHGDFAHFDAVKRTETLEEFFKALEEAMIENGRIRREA